MTTPGTETLDPAQLELRRVAHEVTRTTQAPPFLAAAVLRRTTRRRRRLAVSAAALAGIGVAGSIAAVTAGGGPYYEYRQPSAAMAPTVVAGESVVVHRDLEPQRGDVVQLTFDADGTEVRGLLRVVGTAGDEVSCPVAAPGRCDAVVVNGEPLDESYVGQVALAPFAPVSVTPGDLFVLGDARDVAVDSRVLGPVDGDRVVGVAVAVVDREGRVEPVPGAPAHQVPEGYEVDPEQPVPPASS